VAVSALKLADDGSGDVVVRLYESHGGRATATLAAGFAVASATPTDLLERSLEEDADVPAVTRDGDAVRVSLRPFQLVTLRLKRA
jgi:alpha-mannosidase